MRRHLGTLSVFLILLAAGPALGADTLEIDAPGGLRYEKDGTIQASGAAGKPLMAVLDGYEISAMSLHYDQRKQTGQALGGVLWRDRRTGAARELRAAIVTFALAVKTIRAEGQVSAKEGPVNLQADLAQIDLAKGRYEITGRQAKASYEKQLFQADRLVYETGEANRLTAEGKVLWQTSAAGETRSVQAAKMSYDLTARRAEAIGGIILTIGEFRAVSERLQYQETADLLTLDGQPAMTRGDLKLTAAYLAWQPAKGLVVATGGANLSGQAFIGSSDELRYETKENRFYLLGAARLTRGQDTLIGEEIVYDLASGRVSVAGRAKAVISMGG